jgi:hypothetical protein
MSSDTGRTSTTPLLQAADVGHHSTVLALGRRVGSNVIFDELLREEVRWGSPLDGIIVIDEPVWEDLRPPLLAVVAQDTPTSIDGRRPLRAPPQDHSTGARSTSGEHALRRRASWATSPALATTTHTHSLSLLISCGWMRSEWIRVCRGHDGASFWSSKVGAWPSDLDGRSAWF